MKKETIIAIKREIKNFTPVVDAIAETYPSSMCGIAVVRQLLSNLAADSSDTSSYSVEKDTEDIYRYKDALMAISEYHNFHFLVYIYSEVSMIIDGHSMSEELDYAC